MRKFFIYFGIHLLGLLLISFVFMQILKKDIPGKNPDKLEYQNENINITYEPSGFPSIHSRSATGFAYGAGYLWSKDRITQLHLWKQLVKGNSAYTLQNDSLLTGDIIIKSMQIDSVANTLYTQASPDFKQYLTALATGFNAGSRFRQKSGKLPFLFSKLKLKVNPWHPSDFIGIMMAQAILTGIPQTVYENNILNTPELSSEQKKLFQYFLEQRQRLLPEFTNTLFYPVKKKGFVPNSLLVFETNMLPPLSYPVQWIRGNFSAQVVLSAGLPLPIYIGYATRFSFFDPSCYFYVQYKLGDPKNEKAILSKKISVLKSDGSTHWAVVRQSGKFQVVTENNKNYLACRIKVPPADEWNTWHPGLFSLQEMNVNLCSPEVLPHSFFIGPKKISANFRGITDWNQLLRSPEVDNVFMETIAGLIQLLPAENQFQNSNTISILNLMKYENDFVQTYSILPLIWKEIICYLNQTINFSETPDKNLLQLMQMPETINRMKQFSPDMFRDFLEHMEQKYGKDPAAWQWSYHYPALYRYMVSDRNIKTILKHNHMHTIYSYGLDKQSILPLTRSVLFRNTIYSDSTRLNFIGNWNEQLNHPDFWKFNQ